MPTALGRTRRSLLPILAGLACRSKLLRKSRTSWLPGLQLYTVRDLLSADRESTLKSVADIGYREVELRRVGWRHGSRHASEFEALQAGCRRQFTQATTGFGWISLPFSKRRALSERAFWCARR